MALVKALIINLDTVEQPIEVMFNPEEYSISKSVNYSRAKIPKKSSPTYEYGHGFDETLSLELFFDTYETGLDVRHHIEPIAILLEPGGKGKKPPVCLFAWGTLNFRCRLQSITKKFTMFQANGTPVRATLSVSFLGDNLLDTEFARSKAPLVNLINTHVVREGENIRQIAQQVYNDPGKWRKIADDNNIEDPDKLNAGQFLTIPPLF